MAPAVEMLNITKRFPGVLANDDVTITVDQGQILGLEAVRSHCRSELDALSANQDERLRSYQTLGLCTGAALAILFV